MCDLRWSPKSEPALVHEVDALSLFDCLSVGEPELLCFDPPYPTLEEHRVTAQGKPRGRVPRLKEWFPTESWEAMERVFDRAFAVLARDARMLVFTDPASYARLVGLAERCGWRQRRHVVWVKSRGLTDLRPSLGMGYVFRRAHELVLVFEKGKPRTPSDRGVGDVLQFPACRRPIHGGYPTQKPVGLLRVLIRQTSPEGGLVVDPYCGSGSTALASLAEGRRWVGGDISERAVAITRQRVEWRLSDERYRRLLASLTPES